MSAGRLEEGAGSVADRFKERRKKPVFGGKRKIVRCDRRNGRKAGCASGNNRSCSTTSAQTVSAVVAIVWHTPASSVVPKGRHRFYASSDHLPITTPQIVALELTCMMRFGHEGFKAISILSPLGSTRSCLKVAV